MHENLTKHTKAAGQNIEPTKVLEQSEERSDRENLSQNLEEAAQQDLSTQQLDQVSGGRAGLNPDDGWISIKRAQEQLK